MKKKIIVLILFLCVATVVFLRVVGVGYYYSGAAGADLTAELESIYGAEYQGKIVDNGTEDMQFVIEPKTWFLTDYNIRSQLGLDYKYECKVIFTTYVDDQNSIVRTITYQGIDPMSREKMVEGASLDLDSKTEEVAIKVSSSSFKK